MPTCNGDSTCADHGRVQPTSALITFTEKHPWNQTTPVLFPALLLLLSAQQALFTGPQFLPLKSGFFPTFFFFFFFKKLLIFRQLYCHVLCQSVKEQPKTPGGWFSRTRASPGSARCTRPPGHQRPRLRLPPHGKCPRLREPGRPLTLKFLLRHGRPGSSPLFLFHPFRVSVGETLAASFHEWAWGGAAHAQKLGASAPLRPGLEMRPGSPEEHPCDTGERTRCGAAGGQQWE